MLGEAFAQQVESIRGAAIMKSYDVSFQGDDGAMICILTGPDISGQSRGNVMNGGSVYMNSGSYVVTVVPAVEAKSRESLWSTRPWARWRGCLCLVRIPSS